ncbi:MAG: hypothetical protein JWL69_1869 [Phycisphaerales bacterium]|nr:hypothetical protein [Phycisphaerales bacterium]
MPDDRIDHDGLFKTLLTTFFFEFVELFLPELAAYVGRERVEFLDKEIFTDVLGNDRHEVDLIAKVRFREQDAFFLIHIENQSSAQDQFPKRMFRYFARLHEKFDLPVYPVALFSYDVPQRPEPENYRVDFPDKTVLDFSYRVIQLNRLKWRDFIRQPNPVAAALMAKMQIPAEDRPRVKVEFMRMMATLRLDVGRSSQIRAFMETYLRLTSEEMARYNREVEAIAPKERETIMDVVYEWDREAVERGMQKGSHNKGVKDVLRLLSHRFGAIPQELQARIDGLADPVLDDLLVDLLGFASLSDAEAWIAAHG